VTWLVVLAAVLVVSHSKFGGPGKEPIPICAGALTVVVTVTLVLVVDAIRRRRRRRVDRALARTHLFRS
jgi:hypothetical protein